MTRLVSLLVGSHFCPPAKVLLDHIPAGAPLKLEPEPDNPYDSDAILVLVEPSAIPASQHDALREKLPASGYDWDELLQAATPLQLGHVASSEGKPLLKAKIFDSSLVGTLEFKTALADAWAEASFGVGADGKPLVILGKGEAE